MFLRRPKIRAWLFWWLVFCWVVVVGRGPAFATATYGIGANVYPANNGDLIHAEYTSPFPNLDASEYNASGTISWYGTLRATGVDRQLYALHYVYTDEILDTGQAWSRVEVVPDTTLAPLSAGVWMGRIQFDVAHFETFKILLTLQYEDSRPYLSETAEIEFTPDDLEQDVYVFAQPLFPGRPGDTLHSVSLWFASESLESQDAEFTLDVTVDGFVDPDGRHYALYVDEFREVTIPPPNNNPVPEPATVALVGLGLGGVVVWRRRWR